MIEPSSAKKLPDIMPLRNVWSGRRSSHKTGGFSLDHAGILNGLVMISEGACGPSAAWWSFPGQLKWAASGAPPVLPLVCLPAGRMRTHGNKCAAAHPCSYRPSCFAPCRTKDAAPHAPPQAPNPKSKTLDMVERVHKEDEAQWARRSAANAGSTAVTLKHERKLMECH